MGCQGMMELAAPPKSLLTARRVPIATWLPRTCGEGGSWAK